MLSFLDDRKLNGKSQQISDRKILPVIGKKAGGESSKDGLLGLVGMGQKTIFDDIAVETNVLADKSAGVAGKIVSKDRGKSKGSKD